MMSVGSFLHRGYRLYLKIPPFRGTRKIPRLLKVTLYCNLSNFWRELKSIALGGVRDFHEKEKTIVMIMIAATWSKYITIDQNRCRWRQVKRENLMTMLLLLKLLQMISMPLPILPLDMRLITESRKNGLLTPFP